MFDEEYSYAGGHDNDTIEFETLLQKDRKVSKRWMAL